ncbi:MAG: DUF4832 domain-containing protein [Treponema sp.]|nr:DUF4832 domain-containing protein [Treponema sp.]
MIKKILPAVVLSLSLISCQMGLVNESNSDEISARAVSRVSDKGEEGTLYDQKIKADDNRIINNPDMGFYRSYTIKVPSDGVLNTDKIISDLKRFDNDVTFESNYRYAENLKINLIQLVVDISAFTDSFEESKLSFLNEVFDYLRQSEKSAIVRFKYNPFYKLIGSYKFHDADPVFYDIMRSQIDVICKTLKPNTDVITAIECDMFGGWTEMPYIVTAIINDYCAGLRGTSVPLLVRYPDYIYRCISNEKSTDLEKWYRTRLLYLSYTSYKPDEKDDYYRLGIFNDDYLEGISDYGTYKMGSYNGYRYLNEGEYRDKEVNFLIPFTNHTPFGGKLRGTYNIESNTISEEMYKTHLSYLDIENRTEPLTKIYNQKYNEEETVFEHIAKNMGYRYEVQKCFLQYPDDVSKMSVLIVYQNNGFANLPYHRTKAVTFLIRNKETGEIVSSGEIRDFISAESAESDSVYPEEELESYTISKLDLPKGSYEVFMRVADKGTENYPIEFANADMWDASLKANKIGEFEKKL